VLGPLTGDSAADGEEGVKGAQLAVKEINAAGGIAGYKFEIVTADSKYPQQDATANAVQRLLSDPAIHVIISPYASTTNFEMETLAEAKMPYIISGNTTETRGIIAKDPAKYPTIWNTGPSFDAYGTELPKLMEKWNSEGKISLKNRKVAIITSDMPYSRNISDGLKKTFASLNWTVNVDETVPMQEIYDWRAILAKIRQDPPDLIVNTDVLPANEAVFMEQFLEDPTNSFIFMQYGPSVPDFYNATKEKSTGVLYNLLSGIIRSPKNEAGTEFLKKFKDEYGLDSGTYGFMLYLNVYVYAAALKAVGDPTNHLAIGAAIGKVTMDQTAEGPLRFDPATHLAVQADDAIPIQFYQLWNGNRILLTPPSFSTGDIQVPPWFKQ
jgi:branched-chain amino acid transport system substrate-binding protein